MGRKMETPNTEKTLDQETPGGAGGVFTSIQPQNSREEEMGWLSDLADELWQIAHDIAEEVIDIENTEHKVRILRLAMDLTEKAYDLKDRALSIARREAEVS